VDNDARRLLVEEYLDFARSICDRYYGMDKGSVALDGERVGDPACT
jgi:ABC-type branched-subunit amino acid transport system ATPase component